MAVAHGSISHAQGDANRALAYALVASILAHALILIAAPGLLDSSKKKRASVPPPLVAHLVPPRPAPALLPAVEPASSPKAEADPRTERKTAPAPSAQPSPAIASVQGEAPVSAAPQAVPAIDPPRVYEPANPPPAAVANPTAQSRLDATPASPAATIAAGDAADPLTLGQYRIAIITAAKRYKRYPRLAMDNNWEGQAEIRMVIGADGSIASLSIKTRSGYEVLDQQALEMIRKAKPLAPIPAALRGKGFTVDVPVVFSLKEETG